MDELLQVLETVPDKYDDFIKGICSILKNDEENRLKVVEYIKGNQDAKSDDIIEYLDELGI